MTSISSVVNAGYASPIPQIEKREPVDTSSTSPISPGSGIEPFSNIHTSGNGASLKELLKEMSFSEKYRTKLRNLLIGKGKTALEKNTAVTVFQKLTLLGRVPN